ncbi:NlpC/P60 family protein [Streptomyces sp. NPDC002513]
MAPERTPGPGDFGLPGMRRFTEDDGPSHDEVRQRIQSLYDRAETDSGTFNATRAAATGAQRRATPVLGTERRGADPVLDDVTRQWFEAARLRLGPTVPAALPPDRMPDRPDAARPSGPASRPGSDLVLREPDTAGRPVRELTAGPAARPAAELTAGPVAALPAAPEKRPETSRDLPSTVTMPGPATPRTAKERNRHKLAAARDLLARHTARRGTPPLAIGSRPATDAWRTAEEQAGRAVEGTWPWQQPPAPGSGIPAASAGAGPSAAAPLATEPLTDLQPLTTTEPFHGAETVPGTGLPLGIGGTQEPGYDTKSAKAVAFARAQIGRPCLWGAAGPDSYDAAGLTQAAWKAAGVTLPRAARDQSAVGPAIPLTDLRPGDLVFFNPDAGHVGLCTGNGMMIHAPGPGAFIREEAVRYAGEAAIHSVTRPA